MSGTVDTLVLKLPNVTYTGCAEFEVTRSLDRCVSDFDVTGSDVNFQVTPNVQPFTPARLFLGADLVLTGYVDAFMPGLQRDAHTVRITGRSDTEDLTDCELDIPAGQFSGYTLAAIARAVCGLFGVGVVVQAPGAAQVVADATIERDEKAFDFLDRLATIAGVLLTDNTAGQLVLATVGDARAIGRLLQGGNVLAASATISGKDRFSQYIVKGQCGIAAAAGASGWDGLNDDSGVTPDTGEVLTQQRAVAFDNTVPRYRPHVVIAQGQLSQAQMQLKANWEKQYAYGQGTKAEVTVQGWRQPDGTLWDINLIVPVTIPALGIDEDLLILSVKFSLTASEGRTTVLTVGPVEGATPDPSILKYRRRRRGKRKGGVNWSGISDSEDDGAADDNAAPAGLTVS